MTPWMVGMVAEAGTLWAGAKKVGFRNALVGFLVAFLVALVWMYAGGDLRAEAVMKQEVVPVLQDIDQRMKAQTNKLDAIQKLNQMSLDLQVEQCISAAEMADRSSRKCTEIVKPR